MRVSTAGECPEWQRGRTVNPLAYAFVGSSPTSPTSQWTDDQCRRQKFLRAAFIRSLSCAPCRLNAGVAQW